jgi:hypothetical protein
VPVPRKSLRTAKTVLYRALEIGTYVVTYVVLGAIVYGILRAIFT